MKKPLTLIRNVLLGVAALLLAVLVTFQIVMRPSVLTPIINRFAADYVEGSVNFDQVKLHAIKSFPYLHLEASRFSITYPHQRYERYDTLYPDPQRRFSHTDTLASFRELDLWLDYMALARHEISVHKARLTRPRIFAHYYDSTAANWDILPLGGGSSSDTSATKPWRIRLGRIELQDRPFIVYTNPKDTLHGMFRLQRLCLDGHFDSQNPAATKAVLEVDSLRASGRLPADTLALSLDRLWSRLSQQDILLEADARTRLRTREFGRLTVPVHLALDVGHPEENKLEIRQLKLGLSALELEGKGTLAKLPDGTLDMDVQASVEDCPLGDLIREFRPNVPVFQKIETDAHLHLQAGAQGVYGQGKTPIINAHLQIPKALLDYEGMGRKGQIALDATVNTDENQEVHADIHQLLVDIMGARLKLNGGVEDLLGKDPLLRVNGTVHARVDSLTRAFTTERGISGSGTIDGLIKGKARLSQLDMAHIGAASIQGDLTARNLDIQDGPDSLSAFLPELKLNLATKANSIDRNLAKGARVLALKADMDSLNLQYGSMFIRGRDIQLLMQNSADILKGGKELTSLMGLLKVGGLRLKDKDGLGLALRENSESFRITPASAERPVPRLSLSSRNGGIILRQGTDVYALRKVDFSLAASKHQVSRRNRPPGVPRDSLQRKARMNRLARQDDFASADISISLGDAIKNYWRQWDLEGKLELGSGRIAMPAFPLRTRLSDVKGSFDNDTLKLESITLQAGASDLSARAQLSGLRRAILGRGRSRLKLKADVQSNFIDANEILRAYAFYNAYEPPRELADASDEAVEKAVAATRLPDSTAGKLIVIPSNLEVDFSLEATGIQYDSLLINWAAADVAMRNRTLQVTNAVAASNMGDIYFEGFYATRAKDDIKAGFDLNLVDITAEKVITLFPAVDSIMPMLTSFAGDLDCELAATTDIDTLMNLVKPSIDGILKISGKDLSLRDSKEFTKIANMLMFRDRSNAHIDKMAVTGMVRNNILEVFPFVLDIDRYQLAASGVQHLDKNFRYHISVLRSPLLMKFGLNAWGADFDHIHYSLGKAQYRNANVPVFTKQLDTVQFSLVAAIHNIFELGVEKALEENRTAQYLSSQSSLNAAEDGPPAGADDLEAASHRLSAIVEESNSRREALREEVLRLAREAALKKDPYE